MINLPQITSVYLQMKVAWANENSIMGQRSCRNFYNYVDYAIVNQEYKIGTSINVSEWPLVCQKQYVFLS